MFDIGFSELLVIALVALVVLGPERLPKAARMAGMWMRRARMQWQAVKSELETELADEDMRRSILRAREELREARDSLQADGARLRAQLADVETRMTQPADVPAATDAPLYAPSDGSQASNAPRALDTPIGPVPRHVPPAAQPASSAPDADAPGIACAPDAAQASPAPPTAIAPDADAAADAGPRAGNMRR
jgi:sec-independent protein translocase protein TatB